MLSRTSKPPATRRRFRSCWSELDYLCKKLRYWMYTRKQRSRAERYRSRLERVLHQLPENDMAIIRAQGWALLHELKGRLDEAIAAREREIELIERSHRDIDSHNYSADTRKQLLQDCDQRALRERRAIIETLKQKVSQ